MKPFTPAMSTRASRWSNWMVQNFRAPVTTVPLVAKQSSVPVSTCPDQAGSLGPNASASAPRRAASAAYRAVTSAGG
jgi:hypothetical protein